MSEKRSERTVITTREKAVRKNPVKESSSTANRGDWEKSKPQKTGQAEIASPGGKSREKVTAHGQL